MKVCVICKTPIDEALAITTAKGHVHPGPCLNLYREQESRLNESEHHVEEIQMIL